MNHLLQSDSNTWYTKLMEIFEADLSVKQSNFWRFMGDLSQFMPPRAAQVAFMAAAQERKKHDTALHYTMLHYGLISATDRAMEKSNQKMKEHFSSINQERQVVLEIDWICLVFLKLTRIYNTDRQFVKYQSLLTREEQEKLGKYGIQLDSDWSVFEEKCLFEYWALRELCRI